MIGSTAPRSLIEAWFDRIVVGDSAALVTHREIGPAGWFEHFNDMLQPWYRRGDSVS